MKKQGLIAVDLDGTLIDTVAVNAESYRRALESFGFTLDYDYYAAYCNGRHYRAFLQPLMGGNPSAEDVERVHDLKKQYYAANMDIARKNEALFVILEALRPTHYLAVITTGSRQNATEMLDHFHCTDWFDLILTQEDVVNNKPDPEGYLKAMAHFGVDAAHTMIFEDSATGLAAARATFPSLPWPCSPARSRSRAATRAGGGRPHRTRLQAPGPTARPTGTPTASADWPAAATSAW